MLRGRRFAKPAVKRPPMEKSSMSYGVLSASHEQKAKPEPAFPIITGWSADTTTGSPALRTIWYRAP
jgi:hypothetical protein